MASDEQTTRQQEALVSKAIPETSQGGRRNSRASVAALQSQLAHLTQLRSDAAAPVAPLAQPKAVNGEQYLIFSLLECELAMNAEHIQGVERLLDVTPVPNVVSWVRGVINLRGSIASVVDLRAFLEMDPLPYNPRTRLLSVQYNEMVICLVVDGVSEMVPVPSSAITSIPTQQLNVPQWAIPFATGIAVLEQRRVIVVLDAARLLFSNKMQRYEAQS